MIGMGTIEMGIKDPFALVRWHNLNIHYPMIEMGSIEMMPNIYFAVGN